MRRRLGIGAVLLALAASSMMASPAAAELGPIRLISKTIAEQATEASAPAVSADGRYVAFRGTIEEGRTGVFRADLQNGEIARVATGAPNQADTGSLPSAPSISADGRYVSFTTKLPLDPVADTEPNSSDVYVADMSSSPPTYELASALDGSAQAIPGGSEAASRVALSADGRKLAFVSGGQVYLRDLATHSTTLVSVARDPLSGEMEPGVPVTGGAVFPLFSGASLSADGTTVAWVGTHLPGQVPLSAEEKQAIEVAEGQSQPPIGYDEPLWRRIADGPLAPTRRIVGGAFSGLANRNPTPNSANGWLGVASLGLAQGIDGLPQLSADGRAVAVIGNPTEASNVFLVEMSPGLGAAQTVRQLTAQVPVRPINEGGVINQFGTVAVNGWIFDLSISANGEQIAFATARQQFPLAPPNLVGTPPSQLGLVELYLIDLEDEALLRVTHGLGGPSEPSLDGELEGRNGFGASAPSLSSDGSVIAFASRAANLVAGDGNNADDVFAVSDDSAPRGGGTSISQPAKQRTPKPRRRLVLTAFSLPNGKVELLAVAPSRGLLRAQAATSLAVGARSRRLGTAFAQARANRPVKLLLALPQRLRHLARSPEGVYATAEVSFHPAKGKTVKRELEVRFHVHPKKRGGKR